MWGKEGLLVTCLASLLQMELTTQFSRVTRYHGAVLWHQGHPHHRRHLWPPHGHHLALAGTGCWGTLVKAICRPKTSHLSLNMNV